ncbi:MAG: hypothetical protein GY832_04290 [Chloroflexi bacterium]|nr:hypothetical protein [Chloroflexota bacterium]
MNIPLSKVFEHEFLALIGWLAGTSLAGGLGYVCARIICSVFRSHPNLRKASILIPWRAILAGLLVLVSSQIAFAFIMAGLGIGVRSRIAWAVLTMFLLSLPFIITAFLEHWFHSSLGYRLIATARTLAVASVALVAGIGSFGGSGLGYTALVGLKLLELDIAVKAYLIIVGLILIPDVLLGIPHLLILNTSMRKNQVSKLDAGTQETGSSSL